MPIGETSTGYRARTAGSQSKLRTCVDGSRILRTIVVLVKQERPLQFFACGLILDSVARGRKEIKRLAYLAIPALRAP